MSGSLEGLLEVTQKRIYDAQDENGNRIFYVRVDNEHMAECFVRQFEALGAKSHIGEREHNLAVIVTEGFDVIPEQLVHKTFASKITAQRSGTEANKGLCKGVGWW